MYSTQYAYIWVGRSWYIVPWFGIWYFDIFAYISYFKKYILSIIFCCLRDHIGHFKWSFILGEICSIDNDTLQTFAKVPCFAIWKLIISICGFFTIRKKLTWSHWYRCEQDMQVLKWGVTWNYVKSPFKRLKQISVNYKRKKKRLFYRLLIVTVNQRVFPLLFI